MKIVRKLNEPVDEITDIFCNKCGQSCQSPQGDSYGLIEQVVIGGYSSNHFIKDYDVHKFSLCDRCLSELVSSFIYPSYQGNLMFRDEENEVPDFDPADYNNFDVIYLDENQLVELMEKAKASGDMLSFDASDDDNGVHEDELADLQAALDKKKEDMH